MKPDTILSYFSIFKFSYINRQFSLKHFNNLQLVFIIKKEKKLCSNKKHNNFSITKDIYKKITKKESFRVININIDMIFKIIQASFIKIKELIYTMAKAKNAIFAKIDLTT